MHLLRQSKLVVHFLSKRVLNKIEISKLVVVNVGALATWQDTRRNVCMVVVTPCVLHSYTNYAFVWWRLWLHNNFKVKFVGLLFTLTWLQSSRLVLLACKLINIALCECYTASSSQYSCNVQRWDSVCQLCCGWSNEIQFSGAQYTETADTDNSIKHNQ